ncbi:ER degradation-enhancing alpha-mannosidase-like protein 3 isoform X2 [Dreissena polymorpha]|uniref:ER degradation-enhancing alpha-mannosidase-like protein 3 isoform X2 n=1 Tax=Dreissena polymorpha TaxID=45954 RepID=UPI002264AD94|nr:ER degradation-enhancing alpha-mannosidase-like protein 3 isoform X2 [Dreissena polymorpha]
MSSSGVITYILITATIIIILSEPGNGMDASTKLKLKEKVVEMFNHAYGSYMKNAFPADELMPLSCKGRYRGSEVNRGDIDDSLGNFSLTLIDSLDTIALLGDINEFDKAVKLVISHSKFDTNVVVSVFETNIRVLGGLLGGHVLAIYLRKRKLGMEWYKDELLGMAKDIGTRLLPAFNTTTGIPYPRINLKHGIEPNIAQNYRDTCTACAGTMILEFAALSRLTGDPVFEEKAHRAMDYLWNQRHRSSDLVGTVINIHNGDWIRRESGVGAGIDSYYEYVLKAYILLGDDTYLTRFNKHYDAVKKYISQGPRFIDVHMHRPQSVSRNFMDALLAFWPGLQVLKGDIQPAIEVHEMLYQVIQRHNFLPEAFTSDFHVHWGHHPLRPEFVESTYFLYKATGDSHYLDVGQKVIENLDVLARVPCGFAAIKDVTKGTHEDQMDSYVLAETFKYLFLLFAEKEDLLIDVDDYVFTTEAHLLPLSLSRCNSSKTAELRLSRELYRHLQQLDDESRTEDEYGDSDHNTCPNPQVKYTLNYAHNLREGLKDMMLKSPRLAPQQCSQAQQNIPTLRAVEFVAGNQEQLAQLEDMGIKLITIADGRLQLLHTATDALSTAHAQQGLRFMQEMIELQKNLPKDNSKQNEPVSIKVLTTPHEKMVYRGGPALFGYDLSKRPSVQGKLVVGDPYKMCTSDIPNKERLKGRIAIVERGDCMFVDKARQLQGAGAIGALVIDHNVGTSVNTHPLFALSGDGRDDVYIPMVFLFHNEGQHLRTLLATNPDLEVSILSKTESTGTIL